MAYHHIQALGEAAIICASFRTFLSDITKKNVSSSNISLINVFTNPSYSFKSRSEKIFSKVFITEVASTSAVCNRNEDFELATENDSTQLFHDIIPAHTSRISLFSITLNLS